MKTLLAKHAEEIKAAARNAGEKAAGDADAKREKELQALMKKHADALDAAAKDAKGALQQAERALGNEATSTVASASPPP